MSLFSKSLGLFLRALPFLVVGLLGIGVIVSLQATKKEVVEEEKVTPPRVVRAVEAVPTSRRITVSSQGSVQPRVVVALQTEVSGRVIEVSENFVVGGYFKKGDVLVRLDPRDYDLAVVRAEARVAEAQQLLMREEAEADLARKEWEELGQGKDASPLVLREPQLMEAQARLKSARADLSEARLNRERTEIKAPFNGRIIGKNFEVGQLITAGSGGNPETAAAIYDVDSLEVRLPLTDRQIALLDLPLGMDSTDAFPKVTMTTTFAGARHSWTGRIARTEGRIEPESRVLYAVAKPDHMMSDEASDPVPLTNGMFVEVEIEGRMFDNVVAIPREAVRQDGTVLVVGTDSLLHFRTATVLQSTRDTSYVLMDIADGERVCTSPLDTPTENMPVTVASDDLVGKAAQVKEAA